MVSHTLESFIFTLQEFAEELISLVDAMERIYNYERQRLLQGSAWRRLYTSIVRRFAFLTMWVKGVSPDTLPPRPATLSRSLC